MKLSNKMTSLETKYKAWHTNVSRLESRWGWQHIFLQIHGGQTGFYKLLLCMVPTEPCLHVALIQHSFPQKHTLEVHLTLFRIFRFSEDSAMSTIYGVWVIPPLGDLVSDRRALTGCDNSKHEEGQAKLKSVQKNRTTSRCSSPHKTLT